MSAAADGAAPILVYDGDCAFCSRSVQFVLRHDRRQRSLRFAARDGEAGRAVRVRHPATAQVDSMVWVESRSGEERALVRSDAVLAVAEYLGGGWRLLARLGRLVPRALREPVYRLVAAHRLRLAGGADACVVFTDEERARTLA